MSLGLTARNLHGLLTALQKRNFCESADELKENKNTYTNEMLVEKLACSATDIELVDTIFLRCCHEMLPEDALKSLLNQEMSLDTDLQQTYIKYWSDNKSKISAILYDAVRWNTKPDSSNVLSWRVDMKCASKNQPQINEPTALFEFSTMVGHRNQSQSVFDSRNNNDNKNKNSNGKENDKICVEMNLEEVKHFISKLDEVHSAIEKFSY